MGNNAYFQLIPESGRLLIKIIDRTEGGSAVTLEDVMTYMEKVKISEYDLFGLTQYLKADNFSKSFFLKEGSFYAEAERAIVFISDKADVATAKFYSPSPNGELLTKEDIIDELNKAGVIFGINEQAIETFLKERKYCTDYIVAKATEPVQGKDAEITYHFDTNVTAKPKLNEDGSVDFHNLGNIKGVNKGDVLATLKREVKGVPGTNVFGKDLLPKKVSSLRLRYGHDIQLAKDHNSIISNVSGHVTLVDDMVVVSGIYHVPQNVDSSTGDINYNGTVEIAGNVLTGFSVKAEGDIIVNGVVEGAVIESNGNIVLKNGMQGMSRGILKAKGNIFTKYLENCTVEAEGCLASDVILHSQVKVGKDVNVSGKRGLVTGGYIAAFGNIVVSNVGSTMGNETKLEILSDIEYSKKANELEEIIAEKIKQVKKMDEGIIALKNLTAQGNVLTPKQEEQLKMAVTYRTRMAIEIDKMSGELSNINEKIEATLRSSIAVERIIYSGVKIVIKGAIKLIREDIKSVRFTRVKADVKMTSLY